jgi:hypothetical protein
MNRVSALVLHFMNNFLCIIVQLRPRTRSRTAEKVLHTVNMQGLSLALHKHSISDNIFEEFPS